MRKRIGWLAWLLTLGGLLAPAGAWAQDGNYGYEVPPPTTPNISPFGHPRMEGGGLYTFFEFMLWTQSNPMGSQLLAVQGFRDFDGSIGASLGLGNTPGQFIGSGLPALDTRQVSGPSTFQPGFNAGIGWRFQNGVAIDVGWIHFWEAKYSATASLGTLGNPGQFQENTFLFSPVFNYTPAYLGPGAKIDAPGSNIGAAPGIWNGATIMTIDFTQRLDVYQLNARIPIYQGDCYRNYGILGPRMVWFWERFKWTTTDTTLDGETPPLATAYYSNVVSNRMWGVHVGMGNEWMTGVTPIGAFSISLDVEGALYTDFVASEAKYELADFSTAASRHRNDVLISPELEARIAVWWYPYEAIQIKLGYTGMVFFNTAASQNPVDFNLGAVAPPISHGVTRTIHGLDVGIAFIF